MQLVPIRQTQEDFHSKIIDKPTFIKTMYECHHSKLFDYADYLLNTNIKNIEIEDGRVIMTTRDKGIKIECAHGDYRIAPIEILNFSDYEKDESEMMGNLVKDGDVVFDIGANIGWYSINLAASRRKSRFFCFEPIPKTFRSLTRNLELNHMFNVIPYNFGLSNKEGEFTFYYYPEGSGNASSVNLTKRTDVEEVSCQIKTLDGLNDEINLPIDFIKCDVEGAELLVFQGGQKTISKHKPIVFSEILRKWSEKFNYDPNDIFKLFRDIGYEAYMANGSILKSFREMTKETIETNFFFLHADKHRHLIKKYS